MFTFVIDSSLFDALCSGAKVVTVNTRIARTLLASFGEEQVQRNKVAWQNPEVSAWEAWLRSLYLQMRHAETNNAPQLLLNREQSLALWQRIVGQSTAGADLLNPQASAKNAQRAYALQQSWYLDLDDSRSTVGLSQDQISYLAWLQQYRAECEQCNWLDEESLAPWLLGRSDALADRLKHLCNGHLIMLGFDVLTPVQQRLLEALKAAGIRVEIVDPAGGCTYSESDYLLACRDENCELYAVANWARQQLGLSDSRRIAIVVPDLAVRRNALLEAINDTLDPDSALCANAPVCQHYNISLGEPLGSYPMVAQALNLLAWLHSPQSVDTCTGLLLSPFLDGAKSERSQRAMADIYLRQQNRSHYTFCAFISTLRGTQSVSRRFLQRLDAVLERSRQWPKKQHYAQWAAAFDDVLTCLGWSEEACLDSQAYQLLGVWRDTLVRLGEYDVVSSPCGLRTAVSRLKQRVNTTVFQLESNAQARLQILGLLEVVGMQFDALWVMGVDATNWPASARPNPFLPYRLQRRAQLPHSSSEWESGFAVRTLERLQASANERVFSYVQQDGDTLIAASSLLAHLPAYKPCQASALRSPAQWLRKAAPGVRIEQDTSASPWLAEQLLKGGVQVLSDQAECPFRAFARYRLHADSPQSTVLGVDASERGRLVHLVMQLIWQDLSSQEALQACAEDTLRDKVEHAVEQAMQPIQGASGNAFIGLERVHLVDLAMRWLAYEKDRAPFVVEAVEDEHVLNVGGLTFNLRVDRCDRLDNGARVLIDYKTGNRKNTRERWNKARPGDLQLPLYALAYEQPVDAVGLAFISSQSPQLRGVGDDSVAIKGIASVSRKFAEVGCQDWQAVNTFWRDSVTAIAEEFAAGAASVTPRNYPETCRYCELDALCRFSDSVRTERNSGR